MSAKIRTYSPEERLIEKNKEVRQVAYFSMEIGLESDMPTYSGGLGVLAGDTIRAASDLEVPMVAVSLIHQKGYFTQSLDADGWQQVSSVQWMPNKFCEPCEPRVSLEIKGRKVHLKAWRYDAVGATGYIVPVYFLDSNLPENSKEDRGLTDHLYGGDHVYRICQEVILGIGGVRMLRALGYTHLDRFHMNEGHAAFLSLELFKEQSEKKSEEDAVEAVRRKCVFTTHTPVAAGHDKFDMDLVAEVLGKQPFIEANKKSLCDGDKLNMTKLALVLSHYVNGVAKKHGEVSRGMFPGADIDSITNGIHCATWTSEPLQRLFDTYIPDWKSDNSSLRMIMKAPHEAVYTAHLEAKQDLFDYVKAQTGLEFDPSVFTVGFARRAAQYKRADLLFDDPKALESITERTGPMQLIFAGKAHPKDEEGRALIHRVIQRGSSLAESIKFVYLPDYDMALGLKITAGVDVWLNNPQPPLEASGTSGMKASLNGVPNLSILDGWWIEGHIEGVTGWSIEAPQTGDEKQQRLRAAKHLYEKLEQVAKCFYKEPAEFTRIRQQAIAYNGSHFSTHRMMREYVLKAYYRSGVTS